MKKLMLVLALLALPASAQQAGEAPRPRRGGAVEQHMKLMADEAQSPGEVKIGGRVEVPMTFDEHVPVIEAKVNGKGPFRFAFDTGNGGILMLSAGLVKQLGLHAVGERMVGDPSGKNDRAIAQVHVDSFDLGSVHLGDFEAGQLESGLLNTDGVLGLRMFQSLLVTFDYPHKQIVIDAGSLRANDTNVLGYTVENGVPNIEINVAGTKVRADIDAGSPALLSLPLSLAKSLPLDGEPRVIGHGRTPANEFDVYGATLKGEARIGNVTLANPRLGFIDIFPVGNIGSRFLSDYRVTFDPENRRVKFEKP